ncbi:MAG: hypothetical protein M1817_003398 [Caeruleum heppii]|nr:MAG: hypothetical protein M1817_003398 [Caeruleum heppii]
MRGDDGPEDPWTYAFNPDKTPSVQFESLLLGLARHIAHLSPTPRTTTHLFPPHLATFYRSVGGDYDPLFLHSSHETLSFIYRSLGCAHSLEPTEDDFFSAPSVPALTPRGFVRWQSIQTLLDPGEHVPYLQDAVRRFHVVDPKTGKRFPKDLPRGVFPADPDRELTAWHDGLFKGHCAESTHDEEGPERKKSPRSPESVPTSVHAHTHAASQPPEPSPRQHGALVTMPPRGGLSVGRVPHRDRKEWRLRHGLRDRRRSVPAPVFLPAPASSSSDPRDYRPTPTYEPPRPDPVPSSSSSTTSIRDPRIEAPQDYDSLSSGYDSEPDSNSESSASNGDAHHQPAHRARRSRAHKPHHPEPPPPVRKRRDSPVSASSSSTSPPRHRSSHHPVAPPKTNYKGANVRWRAENDIREFSSPEEEYAATERAVRLLKSGRDERRGSGSSSSEEGLSTDSERRRGRRERERERESERERRRERERERERRARRDDGRGTRERRDDGRGTRERRDDERGVRARRGDGREGRYVERGGR